MTAHSPDPSLPLRVVPPAQLRPLPPVSPADAPPVVQPPAQAEKSAPQSRRWLLWGSVAVGFTVVGFIPTPYQVGGNVQLDWKEAARQSVHTPMPAVVKQVLVKTGEVVHPGQPLAVLSSRDVEQQIADVKDKLATAYRELEAAGRAQVQAQASLIEASAKQQAIELQAQRTSNRVAAMEQGTLPPEVQTLVIEQHRLEGQLQESNTQVERYQVLYQQGAVSLSDLENRQVEYRNLERDLADKQAQIHLAQQQLHDTASDNLLNAGAQAGAVTASQMVSAAAAHLEVYQQTIVLLNQRLQELVAQQQSLVLRASTEGTVITSDLDLLVGQETRPDSTLLQIANLKQLTANVQVQEDDLNFVQVGAPVTFRPRQSKLEAAAARVDAVLYNVQSDDTKQQRVATVRVVIENPQGRLRPGSSGYAKIFSQWMPLYQRVGRELLKLVPERFL